MVSELPDCLELSYDYCCQLRKKEKQCSTENRNTSCLTFITSNCGELPTETFNLDTIEVFWVFAIVKIAVVRNICDSQNQMFKNI